MKLRQPDGGRDDQSARIAYDSIAPFYDAFTAHHDFELWLGNLVPALRRLGLSGDRLLDIACGTGKSFIPMLERDWKVMACDISPEMVDHARAKAGNRATVVVADMRTLPALGSFDLVWCLTDALNYLLSPGELIQTFRGIATNLAPGGLLAFDLNTLKGFRTFFAEEVSVEIGPRTMHWRGMVDAASFREHCFAEATLEIEQEGQGRILSSLHRQRHFSTADVFAALRSADLECVGIYGIEYDAVLQQPLDEEKHSKSVYIARATD